MEKHGQVTSIPRYLLPATFKKKLGLTFVSHSKSEFYACNGGGEGSRTCYILLGFRILRTRVLGTVKAQKMRPLHHDKALEKPMIYDLGVVSAQFSPALGRKRQSIERAQQHKSTVYLAQFSSDGQQVSSNRSRG